MERLTLDVKEAEIFGLLGPNGSGKSTTFKMLMGLIRPTSGEARLFGRPVTDVAARHKIGFLPESLYFYDYLTAKELLRFSGQLFWVQGHTLKNRIDELLQLVGLADTKELRLRKFSKGMLQRAGIAQALINDPDLVVLDEPMSGLDPIGRKEMRDIILGLKDMGKTFSSAPTSSRMPSCCATGCRSSSKAG